MTSKHTYASRVLKILATMEEVLLLSNSQASPAKAAERLTADTAVKEPPDVPAPQNSTGLLIASGGAESSRTAASPLPECPPTDSASAATANGTTTATTKTADSVRQGTCCRPPEEFPNEADKERNTADGLSDRFPPVQASRTASTKRAGHQRDRRDGTAGRNGGDDLRGDNAAGGSADTPRLSPSESAPGLSAVGAPRPNAPTVLVVYLSDLPPPEGWKRSVEAAAITVAGGARVAFLEVVGEVNPDDVSAADHEAGRGLKEGETHRWNVLAARLSRLVVAAGEEEAGDYESCPCSLERG